MRRQGQRIVQKHLEITAEDDKKLKELKKRGGYAKEAHLIRDLIRNTVPLEFDREIFNGILTELHKIGVNINQLAHVANASGMIDADTFREETKKLDDLTFYIKKQIMEPYQKRDLKEIADTLDWINPGSPELTLDCIRIRREILELLKGMEDAHGDDEDMDDS